MGKTIVFITKSLCYHQVYLADSLFEIYGSDFHFIQVREPLDFRVKAHQEGFERPYLTGLARSEFEFRKSIELLKRADVIILGEAPYKIYKYFNKNAILLRYSERIFKPDYDHYSFIKRLKRRLYFLAIKLFPRCKKSYLLATGAFSPLDYSKVGLFKNKMITWGYFPKYEEYNWTDLIQKKKQNDCLNIGWVSRLNSVKHPFDAISVAKFLSQKNINFKLHLIGDGDEKSGELKEALENEIIKSNLQDFVIMHGKIPAEEVIEYYQLCDIALFTSSFSEGWGVGINEAMNAGCAVVSAHSVGASQIMIKNNENGFIYEFGNTNSLCEIVYDLAINSKKRQSVGFNAYKTILEMWNYKNAAKRLSSLINSLLNGSFVDYLDGPCSKANLLKEDYRNE